MESKHVSFSVYIGLVKLFSYDFSVNKISQELDLDYKSVVDLTDNLKSNLIKTHLDSHLITANHYFLFESAADDFIHVKIWSEENGRELAARPISFGILNLKRTKAYDDTLSFIFEFRWFSKLDRRRIYNIDRFLSYFNEKVAAYRGVSYEKFSEYFLESIIRYNFRNQDYFNLIMDSIKYSKTA